MKLQSDWLIQTTKKLRGPGLKDKYEVLGQPASEMNIIHDRRGGEWFLLELTAVGREKVSFE